MDFSKFPHHRGLPASHEGERQARMLGTLGAPALHRRNPDGSVSRKVGDRLYVTPAPEKLQSAIYTSGALVSGTSGLFRAASPASGFSSVGQLPFLSGDGDIGRLINNSDGSASVLDSGRSERVADFDIGGAGADVWTVDVYRTRNGVTADNDFRAYAATAIEGSGVGGLGLMPGNVVKSGEGYARLRGAAMTTLADGHYWPTFYRVVNDGLAELTPSWGLERTLLTGNTNMALGPGKFLMIAQCARTAHRPTVAVNAGNPALIVQYTLDGGASWVLVGDMSAFADEIASIRAIPVEYPNDADSRFTDANAHIFNRAIVYFQISSAAPITATKALALVTVPYIADPEKLTIRARVKIVEINTASGCRIVTKQTIFDGRLEEALAFRGWAWPTGEGMLYTVQQVTADAESSSAYKSAPSLPSRVWHTTDGTFSESLGLMPEPTFCTGLPIYIDRRRIACVMYSQGAYRLFLSTDRMASWKKGGLVTAEGRPPYIDPGNPLRSLGLRDFSAVACLRTETGDPANLHPQAPWICDARKPAPD